MVRPVRAIEDPAVVEGTPVILPRTLDRYILREWTRVFVVTSLGFPLIAIVIDLTDNLRKFLSRGISPRDIALSYIFGVPEKMFLVLPAAVLFATVFTIGSMGRHSELTAAKASGQSFHRLILPLLVASLVTVGLGLLLSEVIPSSARRAQELTGEKLRRMQTTRHNFVYRADRGWVYAVRALDAPQRMLRDAVLEREGTGTEYPTLSIQARRAVYDDSIGGWKLLAGRFRIVSSVHEELTFAFDSMIQGSFVETPEDLLAEPKAPNEMRYAELGRYIEALERSGGNGRKLRVERALKIAVPFTCFIIAIFGAPMALSSPRSSGAYGIAISLGTTIIFLVLVQLSRAVGIGGLVPPTLAAWLPNLAFGVAAIALLKRTPT